MTLFTHYMQAAQYCLTLNQVDQAMRHIRRATELAQTEAERVAAHALSNQVQAAVFEAYVTGIEDETNQRLGGKI